MTRQDQIPWTKDHRLKAIAMIQSREPACKIALELGRSVSSIIQFAVFNAMSDDWIVGERVRSYWGKRPIDEIAARSGLTKSEVLLAALRLGLDTDPKPGKQRGWPEARIAKLCEMYVEGEMLSDIARWFSIHPDTIRNVIAMYGIATKDAHKQRAENLIRRQWSEIPPSVIAQRLHMRAENVREIAVRLGLGEGVPLSSEVQRRRSPWPRATVTWARRQRASEPQEGISEAKIIAGEADRLGLFKEVSA